MKIVRLNRRYNMYELGYTHALRWDEWSSKTCSRYEKVLENAYGWHHFDRGRSTHWFSGFGHRVSGCNRRPYFIYVRSEAILTAILLAA